jgi:hypothetical protein
MKTQTLLVVTALLAGGAAPVRGQDTAIDPRWLAYLGCWETTSPAKSQLCIVPTSDPSSVDLLTIVKGEVTARERIAATGEQLQTARGECTGWRSAQWSSHGQRLYLRSEDACAGGTAAGTGVIALSGNGQLLYVQSMTIGGQTGVRVQRYREATSDLLLPDDVAAVLRLDVSSTMQARAAAAAPLAIADVIEASHNIDVAVLEALLVERAEPFDLDAKRLVALADAGVPSRVIDLMVALSYPHAFAINAASRQGERLPPPNAGLGTAPDGYMTPYDPFCSSYDYMYPYSSYDCSRLGYGYGYGYGWYGGGYGVVIIPSGGGGSRRHGKVVNGQGYALGDDDPGAKATPRASADTWSRPSSGSTSGSTGGGSATTSTSSGGEQRTAKPRPPQ